MPNLRELTRADVAIVRPTTDGNGFKAGKEYKAQRGNGGAYFVKIPGSHHIRWLSGIGTPSAHLWDGEDWAAAGHFEYLRDA